MFNAIDPQLLSRKSDTKRKILSRARKYHTEGRKISNNNNKKILYSKSFAKEVIALILPSQRLMFSRSMAQILA